MKIEFDGRVAMALVVGVVLGASATVAVAMRPVRRIQSERDQARATVESQRAAIDQRDAAILQLQSLTFQLQHPVQTTSAPQSQDAAAIQVLNAVHPGLGTLAGVASQAIQADQVRRAAAAAAQCPAGSTPQTSPNWQGSRCVSTDPQN